MEAGAGALKRAEYRIQERQLLFIGYQFQVITPDLIRQAGEFTGLRAAGKDPGSKQENQTAAGPEQH